MSEDALRLPTQEDEARDRLGKPRHKQKRKRKKRKRDCALDQSQEIAVVRPSTEVWMNEVRSLRDIFCQELTESDVQGEVPMTLHLRLQPANTALCTLTLIVSFRSGYPEVCPSLAFQSVANLSKEESAALLSAATSLAEERCSIGTECIFDLCTFILSRLSHLSEAYIPEVLPPERKTSNTDATEFSQKVKHDIESRKHKTEERTMPHSDDDKVLSEKLSAYHPELNYDRSRSRFKDEFCNTSEVGGSVFRAVDRIEAKEYAIKRIKMKNMSPGEIHKLTKEVVQLSELYHEHIVRYYYSWTEEKFGSSKRESDSIDPLQPSDILSDADSESSEEYASELGAAEQQPYFLYIKMEFCDGDTLHSLMERGPLPSPDQRWSIFREILDAVCYMHSKSVLHKDLRPVNIFLLSEMRTKIGCFGLTPAHKAQTGEDEFYLSPEREDSEKSDLFALGVVFYELWRHFDSPAKRTEELLKLQTKQILPDDFVKCTPGNVVEVIRLLTNRDPESRPTAREMLFSHLLPHRFEDQQVEDFITAILNRNTSERKWVLEALFSQQNPPEVEFSFSLSKFEKTRQTSSRRLIKMRSLVQSSIVSRFTAVFELVGANNIMSPLVVPYYDYIKIQLQVDGRSELRKVATEATGRKATVIYMETSGILVALPCSSLVPWARMLSRRNLGGTVKRFGFSPVFEPRERQEPKQTLEAAFDICCEDSSDLHVKTMMEAEVIKVAYECLRSLGVTDADVHINSTKLLDGVLCVLEVPRQAMASVVTALSHFHKKKIAVIKAELEGIGLQSPTVERILSLLAVKGDVAEVSEQLLRKMGKDYPAIQRELEAIRKVIDACAILKVPRNVLIVDLSVLSDGLLCYSGLTFSLCSRVKNFVYATGGRYDNLIRHYEFPDKVQSMFDARPVRMCGVGLRMDLNRLVNHTLRDYSADERAPSCVLGPTACIASFSTSAEFTDKVLLARAEVCETLWRACISAVYYYLEVKEESVAEFCGRYKIRFLVTLRLHRDVPENEPEVRLFVKDLSSKRPEESSKGKEEVVAFIKNARVPLSL